MMQYETTQPLQPNTKLCELGLPCAQMVIEEAFSILPGAKGETATFHLSDTLKEFAETIAVSFDALAQRLEWIRSMCCDIEVPIDQFHDLQSKCPATVLLDVRSDELFNAGHLPDAVLLGRADIIALMPEIRSATHVFVMGEDARSLSAVLYLRSLGINHAQVVYGLV